MQSHNTFMTKTAGILYTKLRRVDRQQARKQTNVTKIIVSRFVAKSFNEWFYLRFWILLLPGRLLPLLAWVLWGWLMMSYYWSLACHIRASPNPTHYFTLREYTTVYFTLIPTTQYFHASLTNRLWPDIYSNFLTMVLVRHDLCVHCM